MSRLGEVLKDRLYITGRRYVVVTGMLNAHIVMYSVTKNLPALAPARSQAAAENCINFGSSKQTKFSLNALSALFGGIHLPVVT